MTSELKQRTNAAVAVDSMEVRLMKWAGKAALAMKDSLPPFHTTVGSRRRQQQAPAG
jgi:hypothetical protein